MTELAIEHSHIAGGTDAHGHHIEAHAEAPTSTGIWSGKVFMWLFLCQDAITFFGMFAAYISVRIGAGALWPLPGMEHPASGIEPNHLNINLTALNTFLLICSSVTMVQSLKAIVDGNKKNMTKWLLFTIAGGAIFMGIQFFEYNKLIHHEGMAMPHSLFDACFFMLTGFHGMHVLAGVVYLSAITIASNYRASENAGRDGFIVFVLAAALGFGIRQAIISFFGLWPLLASIMGALYALELLGMYFGFKWLIGRNGESKIVEIAGLYWHFVDLVWIILFTLVYLI